MSVRGWNPTSVSRDVQWWSNAAQPAGGDTEFVYPEEPVIAHLIGEESGHWPYVSGRDLRWHGGYDIMCGMFWEPTKEDWFGVFHHERNWGLLHLADPVQLPGKKLWSFGHTGESADWTLAMTRCGDRTCEIQSGIPTLQNTFVSLDSDQDLTFSEFWIPVDSREELDCPKRPSYESIASQLGVDKLSVPRKDLPSPSGNFWKELMAAHVDNNLHFAETHANTLTDVWPPTGLDLEPALKWASDHAGGHWNYHLGLWYCSTEQYQAARDILMQIADGTDLPQANAMLGLLIWKADGDAAGGWKYVEPALEKLMDGGLFTQSNALLRDMGATEERKKLLTLWPEDDFRRRETEAEIALDSGDPREAIRILTDRPWERHHCRHRRGELWQAARKQLGESTSPVPSMFGEDPVEVDEGFAKEGARS